MDLYDNSILKADKIRFKAKKEKGNKGRSTLKPLKKKRWKTRRFIKTI
jgi:hypothetical protein